MIAPLALLILTLAAFRVTTLVVTDTIVDRPRSWLHHRFPVTGTYVDRKPKRGSSRYVNQSEPKWWVDKGTFIGDLISCFYCIGVWISVALGLLWVSFAWAHLPITLAAIAGGQLLLSQWSNRQLLLSRSSK